MARARNIKPALFSNDELADIEPLGRLLFIGLWTVADYKGDIVWREKRIKAQLLPYDNCDIKKIMINLDKSGFIRFYSVSDVIYVNIVNFTKHQNPHKNEREKGSEIPSYCENGRQVIDFKDITINHDLSGLKRNDSTSDPADSLNLIPDSSFPLTDSSNPDSGKKPEPVNNDSEQVQLLFEFWQKVMNKSNVKLSPGRKSKITARLKDYSFDEISQAIENCSKSKFHMGMNDNNKQYNDIELICRNCEKLESFRDMPVISDQLQNFSSQEQRNIINSQEWLNEQ